MVTLLKQNLERFEQFYEMLIETNKQFNLTRITEKEDVFAKHFLDCIAISKYIPQNASVIDVGTGAGFPSIPLAIVRPDLQITAIDARQKRVNFVSSVIKELKLENITCLHTRAEQLQTKFDVAVSRAVTDMKLLADYCLPLLKKSGFMLAMKSKNVEEEVRNAKEHIVTLGGEEPIIESYQIPDTDIIHTVVKILTKKHRLT